VNQSESRKKTEQQKSNLLLMLLKKWVKLQYVYHAVQKKNGPFLHLAQNNVIKNSV